MKKKKIIFLAIIVVTIVLIILVFKYSLKRNNIKIVSLKEQIEVGEELLLSAYQIDSMDNKTDMRFEATWKSSNTNVANVTNGVVFGVDVGVVEITAKHGANKDVIKINVVPKQLEGIVVTEPITLVNKDLADTGKKNYLTILASYKNGRQEDITDKVTWSSNKESVAKVINGYGQLDIYDVGECEITAKYEGFTAIAKIYVEYATLGNITFEKNEVIINTVGLTTFNDVIGTYEDGSDEIINSCLMIENRNENVVEVIVTEYGTLEFTAIAPGTAEVIAYYNGMSTKTTVFVHESKG